MVQDSDSGQRDAVLDAVDLEAEINAADLEGQIEALIRQAEIRVRRQRCALAVGRLAQSVHCRLTSSDEPDPIII